MKVIKPGPAWPVKTIVWILFLFATILNLGPVQAEEFELPQKGSVVVLGDSITYSGQYVAHLELFYRWKHPESELRWINLGLPSETISGLSEKGHAGGRFPRPDLHERLDRILKATQPDVIIACYGMNCGIYREFSDERFAAFQKGIKKLRAQAEKAGAKVIHVTPPCFDPKPIQKRVTEKDSPGKMFAGYNGVLDRYSNWLVEMRKQKWIVVDAHRPMNEFLNHQRQKDYNYRLAGDGVHINETGHWLIAREVLRELGFDKEICDAPSPLQAFTTATKSKGNEKEQQWKSGIGLVQQKQRLLALAWLSQTRHLRPGIPKGQPIEKANQAAEKVDQKITSWLESQNPNHPENE